MDVYDMLIDVANTVNDWVHANMHKVSADTVYLDLYAIRDNPIWINENCIVVSVETSRVLDKPGGMFEYVHATNRDQVGQYVFYFSDGAKYDRVQDCIDYWKASLKND